MTGTVNALDFFLWGIFPYITLAIVIGGTIWRYKTDQFGWTTRSSQMYESRLLRIASPMFHYGILVVLVGHIVGLVIPKSWTDAVGVSEEFYHINALVLGSIAAVATLIGLFAMIYRRRTSATVFRATTWNDKMMYVVLASAIVLGSVATLFNAMEIEGNHNYRETVSVWFRSLFYFQPNVEAMASATTSFHIHVIVAMILFCLWPFTRLVHAFTAPLHYIFRPYIVYRSRGKRNHARGWSPVGTADSVNKDARAVERQHHHH